MVQKTLKIGLFDSGIGGLSLLPHIMRLLPNATCYYIADDYFAPYGEKDSSFVAERSHYLTRALLTKEVDLIVVACNTATAAAIHSLRHDFPQIPFVGVEPYINVITKESFAANEKIGVLSTTLTSKSEKFLKLKKEKDPDNRIISYASENLAMLVEQVYRDKKLTNNMRIKIAEEVAFLKKENLHYLILGCTHYSLVKKTLEDILKLKAISPCESVAKRVSQMAQGSDQVTNSEGSKSYFYFTQSSNNKNLQNNDVPKELDFEKKELGDIPFL